MKTLYVGNMEPSTTTKDLETAFAIYGNVQAATIITDKNTGIPRGFGFVEMTGDKDAQEATLGLNGSLLAGNAIIVSGARPKTKHSTTGQNAEVAMPTAHDI